MVISKQIVSQFEGDIHLESELGVGSTFTFKFKIYPNEEDSHDEVMPEYNFHANSKKLVYKWKANENIRYIFE